MTEVRQPQDKEIVVRGLKLHYVDWGMEGQQPMLLLHGLQDCARSWDTFAAAIAPRYCVLALDHRGHGDSAWAADGSYKLDDYVGELTEFIETLDLRNLVLVGHSAGGKNSFVYASAHSDRLDKLIIVDMDPDAYNPGSATMFDRYRTESDEWDDLDAVVERLRSREPGAPEETLRHQAEVMTREAPGGKRVWKRDRALVLGYERPEAWEYLDKIACDTLLVRGALSPLLTHEVAVRMQERIPRCELVELDNAGHWCYDENALDFKRAVKRFLEQS
ncbi:MAG: alpha/beta hydrolase [Dehalococcoidia bacterium]